LRLSKAHKIMSQQSFEVITQSLSKEIIVKVRTIEFEKSIFIWIGEQDAVFDNLNVATVTQFSKIPATTEVLDFGANNSHISTKLCKRLRKQVLLSWNVKPVDPINQGFVENAIIKGITDKLLTQEETS